jgi:hypothetical protein
VVHIPDGRLPMVGSPAGPPAGEAALPHPEAPGGETAPAALAGWMEAVGGQPARCPAPRGRVHRLDQVPAGQVGGENPGG